MYDITKVRKNSWILFFTCWVVYAVVSMTRSTYSAAISSIISDGLFTKSQAGLITAGFYLVFGVSQILIASYTDKISPFKLISVTLVCAAVSCFAMAYAKSFCLMLVIWSLNGFAQFALWPAVIRVIAEFMINEQKKQGMLYISFSYCVGMVMNYLVAAVVLTVSDWRMLFVVSAVALLISYIFWKIVTGKTAKVLSDFNSDEKERLSQLELVKPEKSKELPKNWMYASGILFLFIPAVSRSMMDAGVKTWVPTMMQECYGISSGFASLLVTVLVFVNLAGVFIVKFIYPRYIKNAVSAFALCFLVSVPMTLVILFIGRIPLFVVIFLLTAITTLMYSGHQLQNVIIPAEFGAYNKTGTVASVINGVSSFGAVISTYGYGFLAENFGWSATIISWVITLVLATMFCFMSSVKWGRFVQNEE